MLRAEHGGMLEVMVDLTTDTGDKKYSEAGRRFFFDNRILGAMEEQRDIFNGIHANTQIPKIAGLARLYEVEGDEKARVGAEYFFTEVSTKRSYANGGHSESEHFYDMNNVARTLKPNTAETCNSFNMVKIAMHVFEWNQNTKPMDFAEKVTLNHIAANIGKEPGEYGYFLSLGSPHPRLAALQSLLHRVQLLVVLRRVRHGEPGTLHRDQLRHRRRGHRGREPVLGRRTEGRQARPRS